MARDPEAKRVYDKGRKAYHEARRLEKAAYDKAHHLANRDRDAAQGRVYRAANPDKIHSINRAWLDANPEKMYSINKAWRAINPVRVKWKHTNAGAKKRGSVGHIEFDDFKPFWENRGDTCPACHRPYGIGKYMPTVDHIQSLKCGGLHELQNLQIICWGCNDKKGNKTIDYRQPLSQ